MKKTALNIVLALLLFSCVDLVAQKDLSMSQYMHNRYALNTAFAGNREVLSVYGTFRKKWTGFNGAPSSQLLSAHTPLKNENVALGLELYNQKIGVNTQNGGIFSFTYRIRMSKNILALSLNAGGSSYSSKWSDVSTLNELSSDPVFGNNETDLSPVIGVGAAYYNNRFFAGLSTSNLFYFNPFIENTSSSFDPGKANYIVTGGYLSELNSTWHLQPSFMMMYSLDGDSVIDLNATIIYNNSLWLGGAWRSTDELIGMVGYQITPQLRFSYSFDYTTGDISTFNNGTHEISIQYDFGYKIKSSNPKFF